MNGKQEVTSRDQATAGVLRPTRVPKPTLRAALRRNGWRLSLAGAATLLLAPFLATQSSKSDAGAVTKTLKSTGTSTVKQAESATSMSSQPTNSSSTSNASQQTQSTTEDDPMKNTTSVNVNGQDIPVPDNGNMQQSFDTPNDDGDGQTHVDVSVSNTSSGSDSHESSGASSNSTSVNIHTRSSTNMNSSSDGLP